MVPNIVPAPSSAFFSALGTTRADAGGLERQRTIDHDLNVELAKAAKAAGVKTYVLISSMGANSKSWNLYSAMKGQTEDDVMAIGFERTVFVRPGLIVGQRDVPRWNERPLHMLANLLGGIAPILKDAWAQDADTVARAAVRAGVDNAVWMGRSLVDGKEGGKVWFMSQSEIVELGKR